MSILLSIDPATHGCGCALFSGGKLLAAAYVKNDRKEGDIVRRCASAAKAVEQWYELEAEVEGEYAKPPDQIIVELPQVYSRGANKTKGDPNESVIPLAMVDCALATLFTYADVFSYQPHAWKGTTQKPKKAFDDDGKETVYVIKERVIERLTPMEQRAVEWGHSVKHTWDIADAIGVGLHHLKRFERGRVFARE